MEMVNIPLKCECSEVEGVITMKPGDGNNIVCYCDDCQAFAQFLGNVDKILTPNCGSELFQITPNKLKITKGKDQLAAMKLSPKGMNRWYTKCCNTPVANTLTAKVAFNGISQKFMDFDALSIPKEDALGEVSAYCMDRFAKGETPKGSHAKYPMGTTLKILKMILGGFITKSYKPNVFFDLDTGEPIAKPVILTKDERKEFTPQ